MKYIYGFICILLSLSSHASALPDPLNLHQAMQMGSDIRYFKIIEAQSVMALAQSKIEEANDYAGFSAQIEIDAAYRKPTSSSIGNNNNDSRATLRLIKPLYDFGFSDGLMLAAQTEQSALKDHMRYIFLQRELDIAKQFMQVILSDLKFAWDNEAMATAYVEYDKNKDKYSLQQISDVDILASENQYLDIQNIRNLSEINQRYSRANLAELLNRPSQLPSNLSMPNFKFTLKILPEFTVVLDRVMQNNPDLALLKKQLEAANKRMAATDKSIYPRLAAELSMSDYALSKAYYDDWRAELNLVIPLYENSNIKKNKSIARSQWLSVRAKYLNLQMQVRQQTLNLWQQINWLNKRRIQLRKTQEYRELKLDKSRALYEMEVTTDLGSSMVAISEIQYKQAENKFQLALSIMQLRLLAGMPDLNKMFF